MAMVVKNNMSAVSTLNTLNKNSNALQKSLSKVSSGMKINSAQDDASGYAISERMRVQIRSLDQANQNTQNGSSMMKTAEGAVSSTVEILKSLKEKAINSANDTNTDSDRVTIQKEIDQFVDQIDDNALVTFNGKYLVDGSKSQQGKATYTAMTNQSLSTATEGTTKLTELKNRNDEELEIASTDYVTVSYVQNGKTYTTKSLVGKDMDLQGVFALAEKIDDSGQTFAAADNPAVQKADSTTFTSDSAQTIATAKTALDNAKSDYNDYMSGTARQALVDDVTAKTTALENAKAANPKESKAAAIGDWSDATKAPSTATTGAVKDLVVAIQAFNTADKNNDGGTAITPASTINATTFTTSETTDHAKIRDLAGQFLSVVTSNSGYTQDASTWTTDTVAKNALQTVKDKAAALQTALDAYDNATTVDTTAEETALATAKTNLETSDNTEKAKVTAAQSAYDQVAGPAILTVSNVGVNAAGDMVTTADGTKGITITAASEGIKNQISGITISITDSEGNVKKAANASLDNFRTTVYAKNPSDRNELSFQVGASANQAIAVGLDDMRSEALGLKSSDGKKVSVTTQDNANAAVAVFDNAIAKALDQQTTIGAIEARLEYTSQNLTTSSENVQAAESTIRDADMAKEMTNYTKNNVLLQAAQSMLAQANQSSSAVLSLLQ